MFAIIYLLGTFIADLLKSRRRLEVENLFLRHQLNIILRRPPQRLRLRGPAAIRAASTGRTHDRTRPMLHQRKKALVNQAPSAHDPKRTDIAKSTWMTQNATSAVPNGPTLQAACSRSAVMERNACAAS
jgi:hypothetical protein